MKNEIWKDIKGYEKKYQISNLGRIKSLNYNHTGKEKILKPIKYNGRYYHISLCNKEKVKSFSIHRLVAETFIPNSDSKLQVNHKDGNKLNNCVDNLEWCTCKENICHAFKKNICIRKKGANNKLSKKVEQFSLNGDYIKTWNCIRDVERELNIANQNIIACCKGRYKHAGGFKWRYAND